MIPIQLSVRQALPALATSFLMLAAAGAGARTRSKPLQSSRRRWPPSSGWAIS